MVTTYKHEELTKHIIHFCYTCDRIHECMTEDMMIACIKGKLAQPANKPQQDLTRELLKEYEQS